MNNKDKLNNKQNLIDDEDYKYLIAQLKDIIKYLKESEKN